MAVDIIYVRTFGLNKFSDVFIEFDKQRDEFFERGQIQQPDKPPSNEERKGREV